MDTLMRGFRGRPIGFGRRYSPDELTTLDPAAARRAVWPVEATASTTWGGGWSPASLVGPPRVFPAYGDRSGAWAPKRSRSDVEWARLRFHATPRVRALRVFETFNAGATYALVVKPKGEAPRLVWKAPPQPQLMAAQVLEVDLPELMEVEEVHAYIDNSFGTWAEIDTIGLVLLPEARHEEGAHPYRGGGRRRLRGLELQMRLLEGFDGSAYGDGHRRTFGQMLDHDWQARWRGHWVTAARASTSFNGGWSASRLRGWPGIWPLYGDLPGAWAPRARVSAVEWVELDFKSREEVHAVRVFETFNPGAVFAITMGAGPDETLIWQDRPRAAPKRSTVLEATLPEAHHVSRLRVYLDNSVCPGWPELDAVSLVAK